MEQKDLSKPVVEMKGKSRNIKRNGRKRLRPGVVALLIILYWVVAGVVAFFILYNSRVYTRVEVEAGEMTLAPEDFSKNGHAVSFDPAFSPDSVDFHVPGEYKVGLKSGVFRYTAVLTVKDTVPPEAAAVSRMLSRGAPCPPEEMVTDVKDETQVSFAFEKEPDVSFCGMKELVVTLTDLGGNVTRVPTTLTVIPLRTELTWEAGDEAPKPEDFILPDTEVLGITPLSWGEPPETDAALYTETLTRLAASPGDYPIRFLADGLMCDCTLHVIDTKPPVLTLKDLTCGIGTDVKPEYFVSDVKDAGEVQLSIELSGTNIQPGTQSVTIRARDASGNESSGSAKLTLVKDVTPPEIHGGENLFAYVGKTVSFLSDVRVIDDLDPAPKIDVDSSAVNLKEEGTYPILYVATDASGNRTEKSAEVTVYPETYSEEQVMTEARQILTEIIKPEMSDLEKVEAIYYWIRSHVAYRDSDTIHDWLLAAHQGLVNHWGDCSVFQMTSRALLTAAGIENRLIDTLPLYDMHCWNLVNIGEGWYHFDTTAFFVGGNYCYVDTNTLLERSQSIINSHTFDRERYPDVK